MGAALQKNNVFLLIYYLLSQIIHGEKHKLITFYMYLSSFVILMKTNKNN